MKHETKLISPFELRLVCPENVGVAQGPMQIESMIADQRVGGLYQSHCVGLKIYGDVLLDRLCPIQDGVLVFRNATHDNRVAQFRLIEEVRTYFDRSI
jgi:hypothetical protein